MPVNKLQRFAEIKAFPHVFEYTDYANASKPKGKWHEEVFQNQNPITLELACGKGTYTLALAERNPDKNFIGIDIKGARIWKAASQVKDRKLDNVHFLRIYIDHLDEYFAFGEVAEIWITFPDPYPRKGDRKKRLTSPRFLQKYQRVLQPGGTIHFKTDDDPLFNYTLSQVKAFGGTLLDRVDDIYRQCPNEELLTIQTDFEKKHLQKGKTISYCKFRLG